ncbi:hypothetical protein QEH59_10415 [Coraliomargarita sp. SDUM461004]|uniref:Uncharacterized protein n=1 Tax=Thalassobacterium sedimentorum TaxID=3041258 RepID=A0ABU1AJ42_9BACT|nr:hypothetical protein [Coraliomargarita sp. SDUM461004]MDQ8194840.1 hypothetical protein [Coraliomargarita sp. SDUM461004]
MDKIKSLLLPLALVFAAIAVFEFGARYGATNMRAYAIASELQFPLSIYEQAETNMNALSKENFGSLIDNGIAAGCMHRQIWYLNKDARATLDQVLARALALRGDAALARFNSLDSDESIANKETLATIREAVIAAQGELIQASTNSSENTVLTPEVDAQ